MATVNDAYGYFNGTTWSGGQPYTYSDGSSTLTIQNPNNPVKAIARSGTVPPEGRDQPVPGLRELFQDWSERYRQDPALAVAWLETERPALSDALQGTAVILLLDYQLARGNFAAATDLLDATSSYLKEAVPAPGAFALRSLLLAIHGPADEPQARRSLRGMEQAGLSQDYLVQRLAAMAGERYGEETGSGILARSEKTVALLQPELSNYPNPFNPTTTLKFILPAASDVTLRVYDILGREVATLVNDRLEAGEHKVSFDASRLASGVYLYQLQAGNFAETRKLTVIN